MSVVDANEDTKDRALKNHGLLMNPEEMEICDHSCDAAGDREMGSMAKAEHMARALQHPFKAAVSRAHDNTCHGGMAVLISLCSVERHSHSLYLRC